MSLSSLLDIARSGLSASTGALTITGQNVTNATTAGYTKRSASLTAQAGGGVVFNGQVRNFDKFAFSAVVDQSGKQASADARANALATIEGVIAPPSNTIGDRATSLMASFTTLTAYPTDTAVRSDVLAKAEDLASGISSAAQGLADASRDLLQKGQGVVSEVNERLTRVAALNTQIAAAKAQGSDASDLRDQRDSLVQDIGSRVGVKAVEDPQGRVTLFGAGTVLVEGDRTSPLALDLDANGKMRVTVPGTNPIDVTARLTDGSLGGIREARDVDLASAQTNLDQYAFDVANTINAAHGSGYGADGSTGQNVFQVSATAAGSALGLKLDPGIKGHPEKVAAAGSAAELPGGNSGATALATLADTNSFGGQSIANRFASMASDVGARKNSAEAEKSMRDDTLALATSQSQSASGVSLDEEMVDMTKYQRAFEAASKVLQTADSLLNEFLHNVGWLMRVSENMRLATSLTTQSGIAMRLDKAARVASRGVNVAAPSDDPVAYGAGVRYDAEMTLLDKRSEIATKVSGELDVAQNALNEGVDILSSARSLAVQGANGTLDADSRKLLATQVAALRDSMMGVANTKYGTKYLFGGSKTDAPPFNTTGAFVGDDVITRVPLMNGVAPEANVSGAKTFTAAGGRDVLADLQSLVDALNANDANAVQATIGSIDLSHTQMVLGQTQAGLASERFTNAIDVMATTKTSVAAAKSKEVEGDPMVQLTELSLAKSAYERGIEITKQLLSITSISRT